MIRNSRKCTEHTNSRTRIHMHVKIIYFRQCTGSSCCSHSLFISVRHLLHLITVNIDDLPTDCFSLYFDIHVADY